MPTDIATQAIDTIALLLMGSAVGLVLLRRVGDYVWVVVLQGALLTGASLVEALTTGEAHAFAALAVTLGVKAIGVPAVLAYALRKLAGQREAGVVLSHKLSFIAACGLTMLAYDAAVPVVGASGALPPNALPAAIAMLLLGLLTMASRRHALTQVVGLTVVENGIYFGALVATRGLPIVVELGVAADILVGAVVMALVARNIHLAIDSTSVDDLRTLRH
ncbi:MAG: hypothetical protein U0821_09920 [Chloroflexota bacterium]